MKIKIFKPKDKDSGAKNYGLARSKGNVYDIVHFKKPLTLKYICTCKGFIFNLKCKHLQAYKKKEKTNG